MYLVLHLQTPLKWFTFVFNVSTFVLSAFNESTLPVGCSVVSYESYINLKHKGIASLQAAEVQESSRKRSGSVVHNSSALPYPKKSRQELENPKLNKTQFAVSTDWD